MTNELSPLAKRLLNSSGAVDLFTQQEFDEALALARAEIMTIAIETTKQAILIERQACAEVAEKMEREKFDVVGDPRISEFKSYIAEAILNRIPSQRQ
jgi:hypothetical protein